MPFGIMDIGSLNEAAAVGLDTGAFFSALPQRATPARIACLIRSSVLSGACSPSPVSSTEPSGRVSSRDWSRKPRFAISGHLSSRSVPNVRQRNAWGSAELAARPGSVLWRKPAPKTIALPCSYLYWHRTFSPFLLASMQSLTLSPRPSSSVGPLVDS